MEKDKGLVQEGPGDVKEKPELQSYRGDSGTSEAKGSSETKAVDGYDR